MSQFSLLPPRKRRKVVSKTNDDTDDCDYIQSDYLPTSPFQVDGVFLMIMQYRGMNEEELIFQLCDTSIYQDPFLNKYLTFMKQSMSDILWNFARIRVGICTNKSFVTESKKYRKKYVNPLRGKTNSCENILTQYTTLENALKDIPEEDLCGFIDYHAKVIPKYVRILNLLVNYGGFYQLPMALQQKIRHIPVCVPTSIRLDTQYSKRTGDIYQLWFKTMRKEHRSTPGYYPLQTSSCHKGFSVQFRPLKNWEGLYYVINIYFQGGCIQNCLLSQYGLRICRYLEWSKQLSPAKLAYLACIRYLKLNK